MNNSRILWKIVTALKEVNYKNKAVDNPQPCSALKTLFLREGNDVCRLEPFGTLLDRELHFLIRFEPLVTIHVDGGEVNKNIFSSLATDEAEALGRIEPFNCTYVSF